MAPFQAITGRDRLRAIQKKKSYRSDPFQPDLEWGFLKKWQKIENHHYGFISSKNGTGQSECDTKIKVIVPIHSYPTRNREFQKNSKDMQKIKEQHYGLISSQNRMGQVESDTKKKSIVPIHSISIRNMEFQKTSKKMQKFKRHHYAFISSQNGTGQTENERKKNYRSDPE